MKKIIILIMTLFLLTGCFDYHEINKIDIVSAIGIDYQDGKYVVTLEVLNDKVEKDKAKINSYVKVGSATTIAKAVDNAASKLANEANFAHVRLMVLSQSILDDKFESIVDYFLRSTYFQENYYVIASLNNTPEEILSNIDNENPIASSAITDMLESDNYTKNSAIKKYFEKVVKEIITFGIDTCFTNISLNNEEFLIEGAVMLNDYEYAGFLDNDEATIYNYFQGNIYHPIVENNYAGKALTMTLTAGKPSIKIDKKIIISGNLTGTVTSNEPKFDLRNLKTIIKLNQDFAQIINNDIKAFVSHLQDSNSDILGLDMSYYIETRKEINDYWLDKEIEANVEFDVSKKGLIYEVENEG